MAEAVKRAQQGGSSACTYSAERAGQGAVA